MATKNGKTQTSTATRPILTLAEAADWLRVKPDELLREATAGTDPARKIGDEWRFSSVVLDDWLHHRPTESEVKQSLSVLRASIEKLVAEARKPEEPMSWAERKKKILAVAGIWKDDDTIDEMLAEIYRRRGRPMVEGEATARSRS